MERTVSRDEGRVTLDLADLTRVDVARVAGEVLVAATPGPSRVEVEWLGGPEVRISEEDGVLSVSHRACGGREGLPRAAVSVQCRPGTEVHTSTVEAATVVAGTAGQLRTATVSGPVTLSYVGGDVRARSVSAPVEMEGVSGRLQVSTVSGPVALVGGCLADLRVASSSADVMLDVELLPCGTYRCSTVSGDVVLRVPSEAAADVEASSVSGRLQVEGDHAGAGRLGMRARLGDTSSSAARVLLRTVSGRMTVVPRPPLGPSAALAGVTA